MFRLRSKIVLAFSVIIITGTILMVSIINFSTRSGYETFARKNDINYCKSLVGPLSDYYSFYGSWNGVKAVFQPPRDRMNQMNGGMDHGRREPQRPHFMFPSVLLTDNTGLVIVDTEESSGMLREIIEKKNLESGIPVYHKDEIVGYLFAGSMIFSGLTESEELFLDEITLIIILVSLFILAFSIIFSYYFSLKITRPLVALNNGVSEIESGVYRNRIPVYGSDELSDLGNSFNKMAESLQNNDIWRKQIIADSAHELRTPVSLIQGNLEMILDGVYKADKEHLQSIYDETLVLSRLIKELQQLSNTESGNMLMNMEELDIKILVENVVELFRADEVKRKVKIINRIGDGLPFVDGDFQKLKQIMSNIFVNAFRHTPKGGSIEIKAEVDEQYVIIRIVDSGTGIASEDIERIFERFYRTDSSRNRNLGGSGLGLSISREIVKLHNGSIRAESRENQGTSIIISLPYK